MSDAVAPIGPTGLDLRLSRRRFPIFVGVCLVAISLVTVCAITGSLLAPQNASTQNILLGVSNSSTHHLLGTDQLGRDVFSRLIAGARSAMIGPVIIAVGALVVGNALGLVAGYYGGAVEAVIMRWVDLMVSLPVLLVAIVVAGTLGGGYALAVVVLTVLQAPYDTRIIRGATLEQRTRPYVEAAKTLGVSSPRIMLRHIWPNLWPVVVANSFLNFAFALVNLAALSFLGLGAAAGSPDWGRMLDDNRSLIFFNPWAALGPGLMIVLTAASMNILGDWLYERLSDRGRTR
jgi:peptide/nickel transport system permease protein